LIDRRTTGKLQLEQISIERPTPEQIALLLNVKMRVVQDILRVGRTRGRIDTWSKARSDQIRSKRALHPFEALPACGGGGSLGFRRHSDDANVGLPRRALHGILQPLPTRIGYGQLRGRE
jgi:hypothetical protein